MSSLYVKSWEFILISGELEKVIRSNYYYHSSASFTISEELYFDVYGHYKAILSLDCYYNKNGNHYTFDTVREFDYSRTWYGLGKFFNQSYVRNDVFTHFQRWPFMIAFNKEKIDLRGVCVRNRKKERRGVHKTELGLKTLAWREKPVITKNSAKLTALRIQLIFMRCSQSWELSET